MAALATGARLCPRARQPLLLLQAAMSLAMVERGTRASGSIRVCGASDSFDGDPAVDVQLVRNL